MSERTKGEGLPEVSEPRTQDVDKDADEGDRTTPLGLFNFAESYILCAEDLLFNRAKGLLFEAPIRYLFYHAMELYLKAFLQSVGYTVARLRSEFGHDLNALAEDAACAGLELSALVEHALAHTAITDDPKRSRYLVAGSTIPVSLDSLSEAAWDMRNGVGRKLRDAGLAVRL